MKKRLKCLIGMFVLVCFYAFYYWGLPAILNLEKLSPIITAYIKKEYGYNIKMVHPNLKMGLTPTLWLKADSFEVLNDNNTKAVSINAPKVEISLLPLIIGRINLNYFSASDLFADVSYDDKFNVKIGQYLLIRASDFIVDINNSKIFLNKFAINLYDTSKNKKIVLDGTYFNIYEFNKKKVLKSDSDINIIAGKNVAHLNFSIDTKLPFNRHLDDYPPEISATVTNLNLSDFSDLIKLATKDNISSLNGLLNAEFRSAQEITDQKQYLSRAALENFAINSKYVDKPYKYPYKIQIKSNYLLNKNHLNIPAIDFTTPKFSTKIFGSIDKISTKKPIPNLHVKMFNAKANDLLEIIPYSSYLDKLATINISVAKAVNFNANVDVNLNVKNNFEKPDIFGDIKLSNAYIYEPIKKAPQGAKINIFYDKDVLLLDVNVPTESTQEVNVKGKIFIYDDKKVDLHITSTDSIDLALAEKLLDPIQRTLIFPLGPVPIMGFSGYGSIDLIVKGNEKDPYALG